MVLLQDLLELVVSVQHLELVTVLVLPQDLLQDIVLVQHLHHPQLKYVMQLVSNFLINHCATY